MIKITETEVVGWNAAVRGMRNPLNSWSKSDSKRETIEVGRSDKGIDFTECFDLGERDLELMLSLASAGTDHSKYRRMLTVYCDIEAPLYWWKEYDTYKVGTVANSCSTMHTIHKKDLCMEDFSTETLDISSERTLHSLIAEINALRRLYIEKEDRNYWEQIIQLLPTSYNQKRTVMLNYEVLANIYKSRKNHKLREWRGFCVWIEELPYSEIITLRKEN